MKENEIRNLLMQEFCKNFKDDYIKESFENAISACAIGNDNMPLHMISGITTNGKNGGKICVNTVKK